MTFDVIKEQRTIRTLFFALIQSAELLCDNKDSSRKFVVGVEKFIRERISIDDDTRDLKQIVDELIEALGWRNPVINFDFEKGKGKIFLGRNRFFSKEFVDSKGTLLVIKALFEGLCFLLFRMPINAEVNLSLKTESFYEITIGKKIQEIIPEKKIITAVPLLDVDNMSIHENLTMDSIFGPIFSREIPPVIIFDATWKVIVESLTTNFSLEGEEELKNTMKDESMSSLSKFILKLTANQSEQEIRGLAELVGEFIAKMLSTKLNEPLISKLQTTLRDPKAKSYLIYYDCKSFCANKQFVNRCIFIQGMWIGLLSEIFDKPLKINQILHAGKRDSYCMIEIIEYKIQ